MFEMLLNQFVIAFREGIEASLLVATILIALRQRGAEELRKSTWAGVWSAIVVCVIGAILLSKYAIVDNAKVELALYSAAAVTVSTMVYWMWKTGKQLRQGIATKIDSLKNQTSFWARLGMFAFVFFMVAREGFELMLLLLAFGAADGGFEFIAAIMLGLGLSIGIGYALQRGLVKMNVGKFLQWTAFVLILFVFQLVNDILHEGIEAGVFPMPSNPRVMETIDYLSHELPIFSYLGLLLFGGIAIYFISQSVVAGRKAKLETVKA